MPRRVPDTTKVRDLVQFRAETSLDATLREVIAYYSGRTQ
jgi:hypothetical protein